MNQPKNAQNTQWGLVSDTGGDAVPAFPPAAAQGQGAPPLVDLWGRPFVNVIGAGPPPPPFSTRVELSPVIVPDFGAALGFRQLIVGPGMVSIIEAWLNFTDGEVFGSGEGPAIGIYDSVGLPSFGQACLWSAIVTANKQMVSSDRGVTVATGAVIAVTARAVNFLPYGSGAGGFTSEAVVLV